ncbi:MAG: helix-turn-helix transcriptional regulator [Chitinophagaceae bacterium]|nr:helix-turn-helix transcriptional regulator [Chitinophagaceae bacterium]
MTFSVEKQWKSGFKSEIKAFGKRLKSIRIKKGLSQLDLELESGISRTEISRIENGLKNIEFFTLIKLAVALQIDVKDFFRIDL